MRGLGTGVGIALGAGLGIVFGLLLFEDWLLGPMIGVALGLIVGAIVDAWRRNRPIDALRLNLMCRCALAAVVQAARGSG